MKKKEKTNEYLTNFSLSIIAGLCTGLVLTKDPTFWNIAGFIIIFVIVMILLIKSSKN